MSFYLRRGDERRPNHRPPQASARRFFVECEHFQKTHEALQSHHSIHA